MSSTVPLPPLELTHPAATIPSIAHRLGTDHKYPQIRQRLMTLLEAHDSPELFVAQSIALHWISAPGSG
eukprot:7956387-Pyramimonas_sp.AAC.1